MKKIVFALMAILMAAPVFAEGAEKDVKTAFMRWIRAADHRDADELQRVLHPDYRGSFTFKGDKTVHHNAKEQYIGLAKDGKIGGVERTVKIKSIDVLDNVGVVRMTM